MHAAHCKGSLGGRWFTSHVSPTLIDYTQFLEGRTEGTERAYSTASVLRCDSIAIGERASKCQHEPTLIFQHQKV